MSEESDTLITVDHRPCPGVVLPSIEEIVEFCHTTGFNINYTLYPSAEAPRFFIKYASDVEQQARTQDYIYRHTLSDPAAPRVAKVYLAFYRRPIGYMVMDYVPLPTVEKWLEEHPDDAATVRPLITSAVNWIVNLPIPSDNLLGPVGGGWARHKFFQDHEAPFPFTSVEHLQKYINRVLKWAYRRERHRANFENEPLQFYDSDPADRNFLYDAATHKLWRVDFEHVGFLPRSFAAFGLCTQLDPELHQIGVDLSLSCSENVAHLYRSAGRLVMCADPSMRMNPPA